uniref:Uncharacterized protein n=1 Tax=Physcomitrium patens TaxID=3218 RepID=A0A2K1JRN2_PHYPA|nr:hypothetical protein PHYPA_016579 [Physcomitrium patens]
MLSRIPPNWAYGGTALGPRVWPRQPGGANVAMLLPAPPACPLQRWSLHRSAALIRRCGATRTMLWFAAALTLRGFYALAPSTDAATAMRLPRPPSNL